MSTRVGAALLAGIAAILACGGVIAQSSAVATYSTISLAQGSGSSSTSSRAQLEVLVGEPVSGASATLDRYALQITSISPPKSAQPIDLVLRQMFDFDRIGNANLYLRRPASGTTSARALIGRFASDQFIFSEVADVGSDAELLGAADVNGKNSSALLTRRADALVRANLELPSAAPIALGTTLRPARREWVAEAFGDFDGDGKVDILWRYLLPGTNDSGVTFAWYMDGDARQGTVRVDEVKHRGGAPLTWQLIGVTDLDGDQRADVVWQSPSGELRALLSRTGRTWVNQPIAALPTGFNVLKLGDLDGDGKGDIVLLDSRGNLRLWKMDGAAITSEVALPAVEPAWKFFAASDFDGNGTLDLIWQRPDDVLVAWLAIPANPGRFKVISDAGRAPPDFTSLEP
jgi:trimeric autotransporter adhesin